MRNYRDDDEIDWDLEDAIEEQTRQQTGMGRRSLNGSGDDPGEEDEDAMLFDEAESTAERSRPAGSRAASRGNSRADDPYGDDAYDREYDDSGEEEDAREQNVKESRRQRRADRREEKDYEEFQRYKKTRGKAKKKRKHKLLRRILIILVVVVLLLYALGSIALRLLGIQEDLDVSAIKSLFSEEVLSSTAMSGYTNIALFGVDSRDEDLGEGNRTDVMMIASINNSTGEIKLVSVYRDTYLDIGDGNYQKANAAYAYGGAEQAITMLNTNLDLNITDYVTIGFAGVADLIDTVGGVEIEVDEDEISHLNNYQSTMAEELGREYVEVTTTGTQTLNGLQAVAYCRIRYTDGGDFTRTERQREVLTQTISKLKSAGILTMIQAAQDLSSEIETSLSTTEIIWMVIRAFTYDIADTSGFPSDDMVTTGYIGDASCVIPITLESNVVWLHEYLFGDTDYQVSSAVSEISAYISSVTGYY